MLDTIKRAVSSGKKQIVLAKTSFVASCGPYGSNIAVNEGEYYEVTAALAADWSKGGMVRLVDGDTELQIAKLEIEKRG